MTREQEDRLLHDVFDGIKIAGCDVEIDRSGVGHAWKIADADDCPANIQEEIAAEIIDGGNETCEDYVASNGQHYRWY